MKLRDMIWLMNTDAFYIHPNGERNNLTSEYIESSAAGSWKELRKYYDYEVVSLTPEENAMSIVLKEIKPMNRKHEYIITSERAGRRNDERENSFYSDNEYSVGDVIILDGLRWFVDEVVR